MLSVLGVVALAAGSLAQSEPYYEPGVPTDVPIEGNYTGLWRPRAHFSPPQKFMNDPNGLHRDAEGIWHLYYQYNPSENVAGDQHWGHATSPDLWHWTNQPIAIWPTNETSYVFSGSAVIDSNNTSGMFPDQDNGVVAVYTVDVEGGLQTQHIAFSYDEGYTFEFYENNPVLNVGSSQFRDPHVNWYAPTQRWIMVIAFASEYTVGFYTSNNLKEWEPVSNFTDRGLLGIQYECPNLVEIAVEGEEATDSLFLLFLSINPGAPLGGSISQYFPGTFNGTHFEPVDNAARIADFGKDNYASQFFYGIPGNEPQISLGWASNWQYSQLVPTGEADGWRSQMSIPRRNYLKRAAKLGWLLFSAPYNVETVLEEVLASNDCLGNSSILVDFSTVPSQALFFEANVTGLTSDTLDGNITFSFTSSSTGESVTGGTNIGAEVWLDRSKTYGFENHFFTDKFSASGVYVDDGSWTISGFVDRSIIEVFLNGGERSATTTFYATAPLDTMELAAAGVSVDAVVSVKVWAVEDTWAEMAGEDGVVRGNVTASS